MQVAIFGDSLFSLDMMWGFKELGHDVQIVLPRTIEELDQLLDTMTPDLFLTLGSPAYFNSTILQHLGNRSFSEMKCIHWDTDGITWVDIEMKHINLLKPDMVFTVCPEMLALLRNQGIPSEMLFYAYSPLFHHPGPPDEEMLGQITFVGAAYPEILQKFPQHYRRLSMDILFEPLLSNGYQIDFYGDNRHKMVMKYLYNIDIPNTWQHGRYPYERTCQIYNSCCINLVTQNHENTLTKRVFEILGSGGFILSYNNSAIRELFTPNKDLVVSSSPQETLEIVEYYKNNLNEYQKIRENGAISAQNHTYKQRAQYIIDKIRERE